MPTSTIANLSSIEKSIMKQLFFYDKLSCGELCNLLEKSYPIVMKNIRSLLYRRHIVQQEYGISCGGRKPAIFSLEDDCFFIISVVIDRYIIKVGIATNRSKFVTRIETSKIMTHDFGKILDSSIEMIKKNISKYGIENKNIVGIGMSIADFWSICNYKIDFSENIESFIYNRMGRIFSIPIFLDRNLHNSSFAELKWGVAKNVNSAVIVNFDCELGFSIIIDNKLYKGQHSSVERFGHLQLFNNTNKQCTCGKYGCLDTELSLRAICQKIVRLHSDDELLKFPNSSDDDFFQLVSQVFFKIQEGNLRAIRAFSESIYDLGKELSPFINVLDPEVIIITGLGAKAGKLLLAPMYRAMNENCTPRIANDIKIKISQLGSNASLAGTVAYVMDSFEKIRN